MVELRADMRRVLETGRGYGKQNEEGLGVLFQSLGFGLVFPDNVEGIRGPCSANQAVDRFLGNAAGNPPIALPPDPSFCVS